MYDSNSHKILAKYQKGMPFEQQKSQRYDLSKGEVSLPCATLNLNSVKHNINWMQEFANFHNILLAPHGKTSLTPEIIQLQVEEGAWGITVANVQQAYVAKMAGAKRIIIANQVIGKSNFKLAAELMSDVELYICVDSISNIRALGQFFSQQSSPLNILIEYGVPHGRCGARTEAEVNDLVDELAQHSGLSLQGLEFYEGVIHGGNEEKEVQEFVSQVCDLFMRLDAKSTFNCQSPIITGAGSAWYDIVTQAFQSLPDRLTKIIRPGCYVSHDKGIYQTAQRKVLERISHSEQLSKFIENDLKSAIEVWAYAQSRPEPNRIIVALGKRDVAFDTELPMLERIYRDGERIEFNAQLAITKDVMDQHMFLEVPDDCPICVGDALVFSTSHPCITFDKWRHIAISENNIATHWMKTEF